ncbi:MAG: phytanoyl-CoA dioxygenase family protein [Betaproteobacteria bacterium AqS2]|uniref:Phytanoyl-CoA dioxygenase family protein n=1 Tax=Candidatus Amphirhobacter heronislandensis TaxID=1732024 RepID=A0A930UHK6_9GAMM|nr:phytanoyl-CoA dioxygenase family protein [Betaproteobacteria bacterium AqS2]
MGALTAEQKEFFAENGYLVARGAAAPGLRQAIVAEYEAKLQELIADWIAAGRMAADQAGLPFKESIMASYAAGCDFFQPLDISLPGGDIGPDTPMHASPAVFALMVSDGILDIMEDLLGPEILSNPIQHVRIKPPSRILSGDEHRSHITHTAWHQDRGVARASADQTSMVTVWVAITDADEQNGCLQVIPGSHKGELLGHCPQPQAGIPANLMDESKARPLPVKAGDAICFHPLTIHGAMANVSERLRWSFDLRYSKAGEPTGREEFPDFVARSRANPASELRDAAEWERMWAATKENLTGVKDLRLHRWSQDAPICA